MKDDKIRVCPFCGDSPTKNIIKDSYYRDRFVIECGNCGLTMFDIAEDSLLIDWNKRVSDKEIEGLKNQIEKMNHEDYGDCFFCKYSELFHYEIPCNNCKHRTGIETEDNWEKKEIEE
jgi:transcription elongation factor Elf1